MGSEQVFRAEEGEDSNVLLTVAFDGLKPVVHEAVAYDGGQAVILLERRGTLERMANGVDHVVPERYCDLLGGCAGAVFIAYGVGLLLFEVWGIWRRVLLILQGTFVSRACGGDSVDAFRHSLQSAKSSTSILQNFCDSAVSVVEGLKGVEAPCDRLGPSLNLVCLNPPGEEA